MRPPSTCVFCLLERGRQISARSFASTARHAPTVFAARQTRYRPAAFSVAARCTGSRTGGARIGFRTVSSDSPATKENAQGDETPNGTSQEYCKDDESLNSTGKEVGRDGSPSVTIEENGNEEVLNKAREDGKDGKDESADTNSAASSKSQKRAKRKNSSTVGGKKSTAATATASASTLARARARANSHALLNFKTQMKTYLNSSPSPDMTVEEALQGPAQEYKPQGAKPKAAALRHRQATYEKVATVLKTNFGRLRYADFVGTLEDLFKWKASGLPAESSLLAQQPSLAELISELGLADQKGLALGSSSTRTVIRIVSQPVIRRIKTKTTPSEAHVRNTGTQKGADAGPGAGAGAVTAGGEEEVPPPAGSFQALKNADKSLTPLDTGDIQVPRLSFDLSRVLFNPGVYRLQDPRSRVYNFDPYLEKIMPVTEFNFEALNQYVTSSQDSTLRDLAVQRQKRYIGSSSSMTSALAHFHFLLSAWRPLNVNNLSRGIKIDSDNFTRFQRAPTAAFLRYQDGVYAMDADKEFDEATILLSLGKSMEKLLTLEKSDYEKLRRSNAIELGNFDLSPEQYHYSELGPFLMRSQLDAHDPRLPGTGMFDLKTRAVVAVRMTAADERGSGYEIKRRHGTWESFEREYYDMMRSAFLKYSLQVRMGRMDGVFVAYHNIARIFGFQYISLAEMDRAIHGQDDNTLGDLEFSFSINLLTEVFNRATAAFPEQSLRFHFETRESTAVKSEGKPWMYIFAEPVTEEEVDRIQSSRSKEVKEAEARILSGQAAKTPAAKVPDKEEEEEGAQQAEAPYSNAANSDFLNSLNFVNLDGTTSDNAAKTAPRVLAMKLVVESRVDGKKTIRPEDLTAKNKWDLSYSITELPESQAQTKYAQCKTRRSLLFNSVRDNEIAAEGYIARLLDMSRAGAAWRKQRDAMDAAKGPVVLYER